MTERLSLVDAHMHLWDLERIRYPWLTPPLPIGITGDVASIAHNYLLDDYLADAEQGGVHVEKIVHIEAGAHPDDALSEGFEIYGQVWVLRHGSLSVARPRRRGNCPCTGFPGRRQTCDALGKSVPYEAG